MKIDPDQRFGYATMKADVTDVVTAHVRVLDNELRNAQAKTATAVKALQEARSNEHRARQRRAAAMRALERMR